MINAFSYIWEVIFNFWGYCLEGFNQQFSIWIPTKTLEDYTFNIYLFSDSGWFNEGITIQTIVLVILTVLTFIIIFKFLLKIIKLPLRFFK